MFDSTNIAANTSTAEDLASTKLNPPLLLLTLASKINIWHRTRKVFVVNVNNLLDVPVAEVLGLESRGQTGCSWARRPPRQHLTRLIEEHTIKDCFSEVLFSPWLVIWESYTTITVHVQKYQFLRSVLTAFNHQCAENELLIASGQGKAGDGGLHWRVT